MTPKSFLELLSLYTAMLDEKREQMDAQIQRLSIGCTKLNDTNAMVQGMQEELNALQPELEKKTKETESTIITVTKEKADADKKKAIATWSKCPPWQCPSPPPVPPQGAPGGSG